MKFFLLYAVSHSIRLLILVKAHTKQVQRAPCNHWGEREGGGSSYHVRIKDFRCYAVLWSDVLCQWYSKTLDSDNYLQECGLDWTGLERLRCRQTVPSPDGRCLEG
jgi:hypothetical protein